MLRSVTNAKCFHTGYRGPLNTWLEYDNDVNHVLLPSHSPDINTNKHPWEHRVKQRSLPPTSKHQ